MGDVGWVVGQSRYEGLGQATSAGVRVDAASALKVSAVFACVRNISEDLAKLPLVLYRRRGDGGKARATDHRLYRTLLLAPNDDMNALAAEQALLAGALLYGSGEDRCGGVAEILRSGGDEPVGYVPLEPWATRCLRDDHGRMYYEHRSGPSATPRILEPRDVLHIQGFTLDGVLGAMIARLGRESIALSIAAMDFTAGFFGRGATPSGVVVYPPGTKRDQIQEFRKDFDARYAGIGKHHSTLHTTADWRPAGVTPEDSQMIETLHFGVEEVARWFRCPQHTIGHLLRSTNNNIEHQGLEYASYTLGPWATRVEQEVDRKMLPVEEGANTAAGDLFVEHDMDHLQFVPFREKTEALSKAVNFGLMTRNEARDKLSMNPAEGGDAFLVPQNMAQLDENGAPVPVSGATSAPEEKRDGESQDEPADSPGASGVASGGGVGSGGVVALEALAAEVRRLLAREASYHAKDRAGDDRQAWYARHRDSIRDAVTPALRGLAGDRAEAIADQYAHTHIGVSLMQPETLSGGAAERRAVGAAGDLVGAALRWGEPENES